VSLMEKVISGDGVRRTRLHNEAGALIDQANLPGIFPSAWTWMRSRISGRYADAPWWVWEAAAFVATHLRPYDRVLEAGSGYSTIWLAKRCGLVASIEEVSSWREQVGRQAEHCGLKNVILHAGRSGTVFRELFDAERWDVVVIDSPRDRLGMFRRLVHGPRPRIVVYDDTDRAENRVALQMRHGYLARSFVGFKPQTLHACETTVFVRPETVAERIA